MNNEVLKITFTEKGKKLNEAIEASLDQWLEASELTRKKLLEYKNVQGFHIIDDEEGFQLAYFEDEIEKYIGVGLYREQKEAAEWIFGYICAILDNGNDYKSEFSKEYLKWGAKYE